MEQFQNKDIEEKIIYDDSWNMFKKQVQGTPYEHLASKTKAEVREF